MRVKITDVVTSMRMLKNAETDKHMIYLGIDLNSDKNGSKYGWAYRITRHTPEEIAEGKKENPQVVTMPIETLCEQLGITVLEEDKGKTFVAFPQENGFTWRMDYCPAYENIPKGIDGILVEVEV